MTRYRSNERSDMIYYDIHSHETSHKKDVITVKSIDLGRGGNAVSAKEEIMNRKDEFFSLGIHPWRPDESKILKLTELVSLKNVVAIGEIGLDKLKPDFEKQRRLFEIQLQIAEETGKPLIIHCVKAWNELLETRRKLKPSMAWIIHGFRGNITLASQLMNLEVYLSFGNFFNPESLKKAWEMNRLLIETDDSNVDIRDVYNTIAKILSVSLRELSTKTGLVFKKILPHIITAA